LLIHAAVGERVHRGVVRDQHKAPLPVVFLNVCPQEVEWRAVFLISLFELHFQKHVRAGLTHLHDLVKVGGPHGHGNGPERVLVIDQIRLLAHLQLEDVATHQPHSLTLIFMAALGILVLCEAALELALQAIDGQRHQVATRDCVALGVGVLQKLAVAT